MDLYLPKELVELYKWKNGIAGIYQECTIGEVSLFVHGILYPLEYAISMYALEAKVEKYIQENYFPVFTGGGGDHILMDLNKNKPSENLFIISPSLFISKPITIYDSLERLFETVLVTYENNGYYFSGNSLEIDFEIETQIATELNPKSKFWKE